MKTIYKCMIFSGILLSVFPVSGQCSSVSDSVAMGPGYANEVYYRLSDGLQFASGRSSWDIAFRTSKMSSSILINDGSGVVLYTYPASDTTGWNSVDTSGLYRWKPMYNDPDDWENGAFSRNAAGHPDYGWGIYNMTTHVITGDSLFIIRLRDGSFRKLWIIRKDAPKNTWDLKYAALDGSGLANASFNVESYRNTDFIGLDMQNDSIVNFQQTIRPFNQWDILFTKYMSVQDDGSPYPVIGVLSSPYSQVKRFHPVPLDYSDWGAGDWDSTRSPIGWDWKVYDMGTNKYNMVDSLVYFVRDSIGDIYKVYFTSFAGSSTGKINFMKEKMAGTGIGTPDEGGMKILLYPNPAKDIVHVVLTSNGGLALTLTITDLSGRKIRSVKAAPAYEGMQIPVDVSGLEPGIYLVSIQAGDSRSVARLIIR